ncbi:hypothetical protein R3P38DRAFT_3184160 [Favolaschia claudopus]|uniref:Uncharacterized protein n=1 Tax=Favolaschia claudopus TaxID=2862362 RepID=A0AAW0CFJ8_9AGAR
MPQPRGGPAPPILTYTPPYDQADPNRQRPRVIITSAIPEDNHNNYADADSNSSLSLPLHNYPRTLPVAHQISMPNLATQYRTRVLRPHASTYGAVGRPQYQPYESTVMTASRDRRRREEDIMGVGPMGSESSVWRPRVDILAARRQNAERSTVIPPLQYYSVEGPSGVGGM